MARRAARAADRLHGPLTRFVAGAPAGRRRIRLAGLIALAAGVLVAAGCVLWVVGRTVVTVAALGQLQGQLTEFQQDLFDGDSPSSTALQRSIEARTAIGASAGADPLWRTAERLPVAGRNLTGLREVSQTLDGLARSAGPMARAAEGVSLASLRASRGLDIAPLQRMPGPMRTLNAGVARAAASSVRIRTGGLVAPLRDQVLELRAGLANAQPISAELTRVMPVLYGALGGDGERRYLLMFQNNAEERASGGNPAALVLLQVDHGKVELGEQLNSSEFPRPFAEPVKTYSAQWARIYGPHVSRYVTNTTFTPDFPQTADLTRRMWEQVAGGHVDGVISFDPVALSYLLSATGPIPVFGDESITSENAVSYLLSDIYELHPNPKVQNRLFAETAKRVFQAVTHGQGGVTNYLAQLPRMLDERRFKLWSTRADEQALLEDAPIGGRMPQADDQRTVVGVYNNDDATSKMSYFMDESIDVRTRTCSASAPRYTVSATVKNTLDRERALTLPDFVLAHQSKIPFGGDRQWVQLYGPVGSKLVRATIDGAPVVWGTDVDAGLNTVVDATGVDVRRPAVRGRLYGRPVGTVSITVPMGEESVVSAVFEGGEQHGKQVDVEHTPRVRDVPVTVTTERCD